MVLLMKDQVARVVSTSSEQRAKERAKKAEATERDLPWKRHAPKHYEPTRRDKTSVFEATPPRTRHSRPLSCSKVGLAGSSPHYARIRACSPTRERLCKDRIDDCLKGGTLEECWQVYIEASAWQQADTPWPIQNVMFVKVRKRISKLLKQQLREALASDDLEALEKAEKAALSKVDILGSLGNNKFPELADIQARLQMMRAVDTGNVGQLEDILAETRRSSLNQALIDAGEREHAKVSARAALDQAIQEEDVTALRQAVALCLTRGVDEKVTLGAMRNVCVKSKYFAEFGGSGANDPSGVDDDGCVGRITSTRSFTREGTVQANQLFGQNCFKNEGRAIHILNLGPKMDLSTFRRRLQAAGLAVNISTDIDDVMAPEILSSPELNTIWVISGSESKGLETHMAQVLKLVEFNRAGGGLGIIASGTRGRADYGTPLVKDANVLLIQLGFGQVSGHFEGYNAGKHVLEKFQADGPSRLSTTHPTLESINNLAEGWTLTELSEDLLRQGFSELVRASTGTLLTALREPSQAASGGAGPVLVHGSAVQLLCSKEGVGQEQFMTNLGIYTCLRTKDVYEVFKSTGDTF